MSQTTTKTEAPKTEAPQEAPAAQLPAKVDSEGGSFKSQLMSRADEYATLLPSHISKDRFIAVAQTAVKKNPDLLNCTPRSLFLALSQAAQDGLLPDGREGVITSYRTQVTPPPPDKPYHENVASWNPMVYGLRKRARELDNIIVDAQVVHENDVFVWHQGDDPKIEHEPAKLGTDRGKMIGAYAIFKHDGGDIIHREVMDANQIEVTRGQSKAKNSLMWTTFVTEGYRKTVIRRGTKTVPVGERLERILTRDDDNFDFTQDNKREALTPPPAPPSPPPAPAPAIEGKVNEPPKAEPPAPAPLQPPAESGPVDEYGDWKCDQYAELDGCESEDAVEDLRDRVLGDLKDDDIKPWKVACAEKATELFRKK